MIDNGWMDLQGMYTVTTGGGGGGGGWRYSFFFVLFLQFLICSKFVEIKETVASFCAYINPNIKNISSSVAKVKHSKTLCVKLAKDRGYFAHMDMMQRVCDQVL